MVSADYYLHKSIDSKRACLYFLPLILFVGLFACSSIPLINTGEDHIGWMKHETWEAMAQTLRIQGELKQSLKVDDVYTMRFLEEMYGK